MQERTGTSGAGTKEDFSKVDRKLDGLRWPLGPEPTLWIGTATEGNSWRRLHVERGLSRRLTRSARIGAVRLSNRTGGRMHARSKRGRSSAQALAEFAIVVPILMAIIGGIIQFGVLFWAQNTLTQVVRDTGRWEATQQSCSNGPAVLNQANAIAANSSLIGYTSTSPWVANPPPGNPGVTVNFLPDAGSGCPPKDNSTVYYVSVSISHRVPTFFPGMQYLPGVGTCDSSGCRIVLSSSAQFRMEPKP